MGRMSREGLRNRCVQCTGQSVIRDDHNIPILDEDGARQYKPCLNFAANGTDRCAKHGGNFAPTIAAARRRLQYGADDLVAILERLARDENQTAADRIKAINSYLDRAGIRTGVDVSLDVPAWQRMLNEEFGQPAADEPAPTPVAEKTKPKRAATKAARPTTRPKFTGWE